MKYIEWIEIWLVNYVKPAVKNRTYERYLTIVNNHIKGLIGEYDMEEIRPILIQRYISEMLTKGNVVSGKGLSSNTVNTIISLVQSSLKVADDIGCFEHNCMFKIKRPKIVEKKLRCFSVKEQKLIESAVIESRIPKLLGITICLYTGLRIGELLALTWDDIDIARKTISVNKTAYDSKNGLEFYAPKTISSIRTIPIPKHLLFYFKQLKQISKKSKFVINHNGKPILVRSYQRSYELFLKKLGIPYKSFHTLRHTFATRALECGMDVKTLSEILGHKNATITLNRYVHSMTEHKIKMMNKLGELLKNQ